MSFRSVRQRPRRIARSLALRVPPFKKAVVELESYRQAFRFAPAGHFYSPLPSLEDVNRDRGRLFGTPPAALPGIELNEAGQLGLLHEISRYYAALPFPSEKAAERRYFYENPAYSYSDAIFLYGMIRPVDFTFIEPYPDRLVSLLRPEDLGRVKILAQRVQDVALEPFLALERNDILFIDSSHAMKIGSDVHHLLTEILPRLSPVGCPCTSTTSSIPSSTRRSGSRKGRGWNEAYALRAFLFNTYLERFHRDIFERDMPLCLKNEGGSIWLRRVR